MLPTASVTSVFYIYLLKENFEQVPDELYRAAKVTARADKNGGHSRVELALPDMV